MRIELRQVPFGCEGCGKSMPQFTITIEYRRFVLCRECAALSEEITGEQILGVFEALTLVYNSG